MTDKKQPQPGEFWRTRCGQAAKVGAKDESVESGRQGVHVFSDMVLALAAVRQSQK